MNDSQAIENIFLTKAVSSFYHQTHGALEIQAKPLQGDLTVQMRAVQGATSTLQGVYIDVHDQNARNCDEEMRRISTVK